MRGKFIVFEGTDSSGKKTQTNILAERLRKEGKKVEVIHFPTYQETPFGIFVAKYLKGDFGSKEEMTPEICSLFYSLDRYQLQEELEKKLESGTYIISDRYTASNIFQAAKLDGKKRFELWEWIKCLDKRLPQPDITIILNVPAGISKKLFSKREIKNELMKNDKDIHEEDTEYQEKVRKTYLEIAEKEGWIIINCFKSVGGKQELLTPEKIHEMVNKNIF